MEITHANVLVFFVWINNKKYFKIEFSKMLYIKGFFVVIALKANSILYFIIIFFTTVCHVWIKKQLNFKWFSII